MCPFLLMRSGITQQEADMSVKNASQMLWHGIIGIKRNESDDDALHDDAYEYAVNNDAFAEKRHQVLRGVRSAETTVLRLCLGMDVVVS
nr:hypothetical protein [Tanacetum cinerariifolium]